MYSNTHIASATFEVMMPNRFEIAANGNTSPYQTVEEATSIPLSIQGNAHTGASVPINSINSNNMTFIWKIREYSGSPNVQIGNTEILTGYSHTLETSNAGNRHHIQLETEDPETGNTTILNTMILYVD